MKPIISLAIVAFLFSCNSEEYEMNETELFLAQKLSAEQVVATHNEQTITTNGVSKYRNFILIKIHNPERLIKIINNKRLFKKECKELSEYLLDSIQWGDGLEFSELQLDIIEKNSFLIFNRVETTSVNYDVVRSE